MLANHTKAVALLSVPREGHASFDSELPGLVHLYIQYGLVHLYIQYNLNGSNTDGSFTLDDSNFFFSPYKVLPIAQENEYLGIFFLFYHEIVCCVYS